MHKNVFMFRKGKISPHPNCIPITSISRTVGLTVQIVIQLALIEKIN